MAKKKCLMVLMFWYLSKIYSCNFLIVSHYYIDNKLLALEENLIKFYLIIYPAFIGKNTLLFSSGLTCATVSWTQTPFPTLHPGSHESTKNFTGDRHFNQLSSKPWGNYLRMDYPKYRRIIIVT